MCLIFVKMNSHDQKEKNSPLRNTGATYLLYCINEDMATLSCVIIIMAGFMLSLTNAFSNAFEFEYCMGFRKIKSDFCVSKRTYIYMWMAKCC